MNVLITFLFIWEKKWKTKSIANNEFDFEIKLNYTCLHDVSIYKTWYVKYKSIRSSSVRQRKLNISPGLITFFFSLNSRDDSWSIFVSVFIAISSFEGFVLDSFVFRRIHFAGVQVCKDISVCKCMCLCLCGCVCLVFVYVLYVYIFQSIWWLCMCKCVCVYACLCWISISLSRSPSTYEYVYAILMCDTKKKE